MGWRRPRRSRYMEPPEEVTMISEAIETCASNSKSLKDFREKVKSLVDNDVIWEGLEEFSQAVKLLKGQSKK
jgi:hypothetical protein